jgi:ribonucleoside-diphosphate reductase subunit M2
MDPEEHAKILALLDNAPTTEQFISQLLDSYDPDVIKKLIVNKQQPNSESVINMTNDEPILNPMNKKYTTFPIIYNKIWSKYKEQLSCFWKAEEIDFSNDYSDFLTLNEDEQHFITMILAFFASSDGIVNFGIAERFLSEVQITEAIVMYQFQTMMENIHSEVYSLMLDNIVKDTDKRENLFKAIETVPAVKMMADWAFKWIKSAESFAVFLVANACVEGIFFSGAFAAIFWLKKYKNNKNRSSSKQFMNGLVTSNKFISRDEGLHYESAIDIYNELIHKVSPDRIEEIVKSAVVISQTFMTDALPVKLIGMNSEWMNDYIEYIGDRTLTMFGNKKIYNKQNPFKFMDTIGQTDKSNFFEIRPHEYQDAHVMKNKDSILIQDDF